MPDRRGHAAPQLQLIVGKEKSAKLARICDETAARAARRKLLILLTNSTRSKQ
jgi:hypothetical protein